MIPGKKICKRCEMKLNPSTDEFDDNQGEYSHDDSSFLECSIETANHSLPSLDWTPLKKSEVTGHVITESEKYQKQVHSQKYSRSP